MALVTDPPAPSTDASNPVAAPSGPPRLLGGAGALFAGIGLVMAGNGLQGSLLGVRSELEGFGIAASGIVMASFFVGFLAGSRYAVVVLGSVGHIRVFAALASTASSAVLLHAVFIHPVPWALMRFAFGFCMAGLYVVAESWLNDMATNATRGRMLAVYMVITMGGLSVGQLLLNVAPATGFTLFVVASVLVSMSLVPIALSPASAPRMPTVQRVSVRALLRVVPTGLVSAFWVGASHGVLMALGAVYAAAVGMSPGRIALFLAAPMVGAVVLQWPIGRLSDRVSRRAVMFAVALVATATAGALVAVPEGGWAAVALMFVLGGSTFPLYSLAVAYTNDWIPNEQLLGASATLVRVVGVGAVIGPLSATVVMSTLGPVWFFGTLVATHLAIVAYVGWRLIVRDAMPVDEQTPYVPFPARASATAASLLVPRRRRPRR